MVWKSETGGSSSAVVILPDGTEQTVSGSEPFAETIRKIAREAGLSKFNVIVDGSELDVTDAPDDFSAISEVELEKYDEGA